VKVFSDNAVTRRGDRKCLRGHMVNRRGNFFVLSMVRKEGSVVV
jgi:hypothetical protein